MTKEEALQTVKRMGTGYKLARWSERGRAWLELQPQRNYWSGLEYIAIFALQDGLLAVRVVNATSGRVLPAVHPNCVEIIE
jgi:hypothetical protein